jgi:hypothetical protein
MAEDSGMIALRAAEVKGDFIDDKEYRDAMRVFNVRLNDLKDSLPGEAKDRLVINKYDDLPGCPIILKVSNQKVVYAYSSVYLNKPTTHDFVWIKWSEEGTMSGDLFEYVKRKNAVAEAKEKRPSVEAVAKIRSA